MKQNKIQKRIKELFDQDQKDRSPRSIRREYPDKRRLMDIHKRDMKRLAILENILKDKPMLRGIDYFRSGFMYQHGGEVAYIKKAKALAKEAVKYNYKPALWLIAAATDRILTMQGKLQKFGTQFRKDETGTWSLFPTQKHTTDAERKRYRVASQKEILHTLDVLNKKPNRSQLLKRIGLTRR